MAITLTYLGSFAETVSQTTHTLSVTIGSGTNRKLVVAGLKETTIAFSALTFDGTSFLANLAVERDHSTQAGLYGALFYYDIPDVKAAGTYNVVMTTASSSATVTLYAWELAGAATGAPEDADYAEVDASSTVGTVTLTCTDGAVITSAVVHSSGANTLSWSGNVTERAENNETNYTSSNADGTQSGAGNKTSVSTVSSAGRCVQVAMSTAAAAAPAGPTINTQPTAQTARVNGDTTNTATFTVAATTSGGSLTYDWELETSVGGGSYSNLADGSGATWTGQAAASCVGTFTAKTLSGRRVRCNVTDSNGTTTTDAVVLTVLDGPVLSASSATTNGSGVASVTMTSDDALSANGEILLVTATVRGQVVARTTVRPA